MTPRQLKRIEADLGEFSVYLVSGMGRVERKDAMQWYVKGLLLDGDRKSTQPMAARLVDDPEEAESMRQRLQECLGRSEWPEEEIFHRIAIRVQEEMPVDAFVIDDTGFPKKGKHSVGVARQYSGTLGRVDSCQVAVSLHLAGRRGSACVGMRLYLPAEWTEDPARCQAAGVPADVAFQEKWRISLDLIDAAFKWGLDRKMVLADAGYGDVTAFREALEARSLTYALGISGTQVVWLPASAPKPSHQYRRGWTPPAEAPVVIRDLASHLKYKKVTWREGTKGMMQSRFAAMRVVPAHGHKTGRPPGKENWLLAEWPDGEPAPTKYFLSNLPERTSLRQLVSSVKLRWRIERDYQEMKEELGLDHFEGRSYSGFHHHAALCAAAHAFLALQRALFPPV